MKIIPLTAVTAAMGIVTSLGHAATIQKVMASGSTLAVNHFVSPAPDCSSQGQVVIRLTRPPSHGDVRFVETSAFTNLQPNLPSSHCITQKLKGMSVQYKPARGYIGTDSFSIDVIFPVGSDRINDYEINVK